ncbi:MAG: hypothetical protein M0Z41_13895 [Peptococcaceae bacterium]|nr:hypothetical protein [Peptococcaceae bacterium]
MIIFLKLASFLRGEQGGTLLFGLLLLPVFLMLFAFLGDLAAETIIQEQVHYALETALDNATQVLDLGAYGHSCLVLDPAGATQAFEAGFMGAMKSPGLVAGPGYWDFAPPAGSTSITGPIEVDGFQIYNTNYLKQNSDGSYSCPTLTPPLGTTTPWGTVIDRPSVYADVQVPVTLPTGRKTTLDVFDVVGANTP